MYDFLNTSDEEYKKPGHKYKKRWHWKKDYLATMKYLKECVLFSFCWGGGRVLQG